MTTTYDVIVVGLGAMGSAALLQLAARGVKVLGLDRYEPPHTLGSSHGETRITRLAVAEGAAYIPLVRRSHAIWRELERASGESLLTLTGGLIISPQSGGAGFHGVGNFVAGTAELARQYDIDHHLLSPDELRQRFPMLNVSDADHGLYEPSGGLVIPERAVAVQLELARRRSAVVRTNENVVAYKEEGGGVTVTTSRGSYSAEKLVLTAGPWITDLLPPRLARPFGVYRQVIYWFEADDLDPFRVGRFPFVIWVAERTADNYTLFPTPAHGTAGVKMLTEEYLTPTHPDDAERTVRPREVEHMARHFVRSNVRGLTDRCLQTSVCFYTVTPDRHFVIDWHPDSPRVLVVSPCSGHGFKHSAAIGEAVAELVVDGQSTIDLHPFRFERFWS